jgi:hypothetical protein
MPGNFTLKDVLYEITVGHSVGDVSIAKAEEIDAPTCAEALREAGSDAGFFMLTDEGDDNDEYDDE